MTITLNGEAHEVCGAATLDALVGELGIDRDHLVIEHNGAVPPPEEWSATPLREGDTVEMVRFVGGG